MNQLLFYKRCFLRAVKDTASFFDFHQPRAYVNLLVPAILTFILLRYWSNKEAFFQEAMNYIFVAIGSLTWALIVFIVKFIASPLKVRLDDFIKTAFELLFEPGGSFVQSRGIGTLYRIGVKNISMTHSIESAQVQLTDIQPDPPTYLPLPLHLLNDNIIEGRHQSNFRLDPLQIQFVDLIEIFNKPSGNQYNIKHIVKDVGEHLVGHESIFTVTVSGKDCTPLSKRFKIVDKGGQKILVPAG